MAGRGGPMARPGVAPMASFKCVLLGESAVGKSSLALQFVKETFDEYRESTIGAAFLTKKVEWEDEATKKKYDIKYEIWDTAGQERYKSLAPMYYRNAHCAVVVYDVTQAASLDKAKAWIKELQRQASPNIKIVLVGNKVDLVGEDGGDPSKRAISEASGNEYEKEMDKKDEDGKDSFKFVEASAKTKQNVMRIWERELPRMLPVAKQANQGTRKPGRPDTGVRLGAEAADTQQNAGCQC